jgi:hypothetical protein
VGDEATEVIRVFRGAVHVHVGHEQIRFAPRQDPLIVALVRVSFTFKEGAVVTVKLSLFWM